MTSQLGKGIIERCRFKNIANKSGKVSDEAACKTQRKLVFK